MPDQTEQEGNNWSARAKWGLIAFAIIGAFFLLAEHRAHVLPFLPWLLLPACLLMHMFMHGGHGGHGGHHGGGDGSRSGAEGSFGTKSDGSQDVDTVPKGQGHSHHGGLP